jgi:chemotaxis protein MotB
MGKEELDSNSVDQTTTRIIVVKKGKGGHGAHHGGAWKVAYADFVTALMAFFIVMWLLSSSNAVKQAVQEYFRDPVGFTEKVKGGLLVGSGMSIIPGGGVSKEAFEQAQKRHMNETAEKLKKDLDMSSEFSGIKDAVKLKVTEEGLIVELVESDKTNFFDVGSANLRNETRKLLSKIAQEFGSYNNRVIIDGHTDARPYSTVGGYTNWELSADRANAARKIMETNGLYQGQVAAVRGFADQKLKNPDNPFDITNRRISILLMNLSSETAKDTLFVRQK